MAGPPQCLVLVVLPQCCHGLVLRHLIMCFLAPAAMGSRQMVDLSLLRCGCFSIPKPPVRYSLEELGDV